MPEFQPVAYEAQEARVLLAKALLSGKYVQGTGQLRTMDNTYCCLGVACDVYLRVMGEGEGFWSPDHHYEHKVPHYQFRAGNERGSRFFMPLAVHQFFGMNRTAGFYQMTKDGRTYDSLAELNDRKGWTFKMIAALLQDETVIWHH